MAKKARFFQVTAQNGFGPYGFLIPAQSEIDLTNNLSIPTNDALLGIHHLGFFEVEAWPDEENGSIEFRAVIQGSHWSCHIGQHGYPYLVQQFSAQVLDINTFYEQQHADRYDQ